MGKQYLNEDSSEKSWMNGDGYAYGDKDGDGFGSGYGESHGNGLGCFHVDNGYDDGMMYFKNFGYTHIDCHNMENVSIVIYGDGDCCGYGFGNGYGFGDGLDDGDGCGDGQ